MSRTVLVLGGSGFVGSACVQALRGRGAQVRVARGPRLPDTAPEQALVASLREAGELDDELAWAEVVVNAAGLADPAGASVGALTAANAAMPRAVAERARRAGVQRFVHVSSAAVQGDAPVLDASERVSPFSPYSASKALGEQLLAELAWDAVVVYRPQGVHGSHRRVTRTLARLARSRLSSVASGSDRWTPQALVEDVGDAVAFLALAPGPVPPRVVHPGSLLTTAELLEALGGRRPVRLPAAACRALVKVMGVAGRRLAVLAANARRLEMVWFGQSVEVSWLTGAGWEPSGAAEWRRLGQKMTARTDEGTDNGRSA